MDYADDSGSTTSMLAFEIYGRREDLYSVHLNSPAMATFLKSIEPTTTTNLDLSHYRLIAGFLDLPGDMTEADVMQDIKITCVSPAARSSVLGLLRNLVEGVYEEEKQKGGQGGVLTYMAFECLDDDVGLRIFGRWRERRDMELFIRREDIGQFWKRAKEEVGRMEQRCYVPNGKGWLHRSAEGSKDRDSARI